MDAVNAPLLDAVGALFLAEAGRVGGEGLRQSALREDLVDVAADHGVLAGADEVEVLALNFIHHAVHVRLAHDPLHHIAVDHEGGDAVGEALVYHKVPAIGQHRLVHPGDVPQQVVKPAAGDPGGSVHVDAVKPLHNVRVVGDLKLRHRGLAKALHLHVAAVVLADGHGGVDHLGDDHHDFVQRRLRVLLLGLQLGHALGISLYGGVVGVDLDLKLRLFGLVCAFFQLAEQGPVGLRQLVALRLQSLAVSNGLASLGIQGDGLVHQGQLGVLKFLADVLFYQVGIFPHKSNVQHFDFLSVSCETIYFSVSAFRASKRLFRSSTP